MWKYVTILIILIAVCLNYINIDVLNQIYNFVKSDHNNSKFKLFTQTEIAQYNGINKPELYLVILGNVFDVTKGAKYYGPGETYHVFVGQDASRSFVTGKFNKEDVSDDVTGLNPQDLRSIKNWLNFYKKEYVKKGKLIGKYYNNEGKLTSYGKEIKKLIKTAELKEVNDNNDKLKFPPCNVEWDRDKGTRVWCTNKSGGIDRNWIGVPRKYYEVGQTDFRCACIHESNQDLGNIKEYENCLPDSISCFIQT